MSLALKGFEEKYFEVLELLFQGKRQSAVKEMMIFLMEDCEERQLRCRLALCCMPSLMGKSVARCILNCCHGEFQGSENYANFYGMALNDYIDIKEGLEVLKGLEPTKETK